MRDDETNYERVKRDIKERADVSIERIHEFLDSRSRFILTLEPDPFYTGKIWFAKLQKDSSCILLASMIDANSLSSQHFFKHLAMLLLVQGYLVQPSRNEEFAFSPQDFARMREFEIFFLNSEFEIDYEYSNEEKLYNIICSNEEKKLQFVEIGGISARGVSILTKQLGLILAGMGKYITMPDGTVCNRYGVVEFCPEPPETKNEYLEYPG